MNMNLLKNISDHPDYGPLKIAGLYVSVGSLWILASDELAALISPTQYVFTLISIAKGWVYVLATGLLLYWLVKRYVHSLQEAEKNLVFTLSRTMMSVWEWDLQTNRIVWSPMLFNVTGIKKEDIASSHGRFNEFIHPDDMDRILNAARTAMEKNSLFTEEFRIVHPGGEVRWLSNMGRFEIDLADNRVYMVGTVQDITVQKQAQHALRESERRYRTLFENVPVAIWEEDFSQAKAHLDSLKQQGISDFRGHFESRPDELRACLGLIRILDVNDTALKTYHAQSKAELIAGAYQPANEAEREQYISGLMALAEGQTRFNWEGTDQTVNGEVIDIILNWSVVPGHESDFSRVLVTTADVTERNLAKIQRVDTESRYRSLFENMLDGYAHCRMLFENGEPYDFMYLSVNPAFEALTGLKDVAGKWVSEVIPDIQETNPEIFEIYGEVASTGIPAKFETYVPQLESGTWFSISAYSPGKQEFVAVFQTVTERKRAEEALRASEERFRSLYENATVGMYRTTPDGKILLANPALVAMLGYSSFDELSIRNLEQEGYEAGYKRSEFRRLLESVGEIRGLESAWTRKDGAAIFVRESSKAVRDAEGGVLYYEGTVEDITERKRAEENYRSIFENSLDGIFQSTPEGRYLTVNPTCARIYGYDSPADMVGSVSDIASQIYVDASERENFLLAMHTHGKVENFEAQNRRKDGGVIWTSTSARAVRDADGRILYYEGFLKNITRRKKAEQAIMENEAFTRAVLDNLPIGVAVNSVDPTVTFNYMNDNFPKFYKTTREQITDPNAFWEAVYEDPEFREQMRRRVLEDCASGNVERMAWFDVPITRTGSETHFINARNVPVPGSPLTISTVWDVTDRKRTQEALQQSEKRLLLALSAAKMGVWEWDFQKAVLHGSPDFFKIMGLPQNQADLSLADLPALIHSEDWANLEEMAGKAMTERGQLDVEFRLAPTGGDTHWLSVYGLIESAADGTPAQIIGTIQDISDRRESENRLRASEERFGQLVNHIQEAFWMADLDENREVYISRAAETIWGRPVPELMHSTTAFLESILPEDREAVQQVYTRQRNGEPTETEYRVVHPDGSVHWIWDRAFPISDEHGKVKYLAGIAADVTQRKLADEALRASEERFGNAFEFAAIGMAIVSLDGHWLRVNQALCKLVGFSSDELLTRTFQEITHPDDLGADLESVDQLLAGKIQSYHMEKRYFHKLGHVVWVLLSVSLVKNDRGEPQYFISQIQDITERKAAADALQESEVRFAGVVNSAMDAIISVDDDQNIVLFNPAAEQVFWCSAEEVIGRPLDRLIPERHRLTHRDHVAQFGQTGVTKRSMGHLETLSGLRANGEEFPIEASISHIRTVDQNLYTVILRDITQRRQAEVETRRNLAELEALYENGLAVGRLLEPREIGERIIRTFAQHLSWHHVTIRLRQPENDKLELIAFNEPGMNEMNRDEVERRFNSMIERVGQGLSGKVVRTGKAVRTGNVRLHPQYINTYEGIQSGLYMPLRVGERVIGVISVESEQPEAFTENDERLLATLANQAAIAFENARLFQTAQAELSERRRVEELLAHERNQLAIHVKERTADLSRANANLARALRVKDEFLANMSHELRTPLNAILGLSESLGEQIAGPLNEKQLKYITTIGESGHHLLSLINDILDLAKIEAGQITLDINKVDVRAVCQASLRMVKQLAQNKRQEVSMHVDEDLALMWADERRLKQMIVNLLSNAVKFTPEEKRLGVEVHGNQEENSISITVWDEGIGISEEGLKRLFRPFVQLDSSLARESTGTGLGLTLVAQMARMHGGRVEAASQPGRGSRFTIVLPWEPSLTADAIARLVDTGRLHRQGSAGRNKQTVLLVEDTAEVIMLLKDYLETAGYQVFTAQDGLEGMEQAKKLSPDLILMDVMMPRLDGLEATRKLRSDPQFRTTPILGLTALAMPDDRERCLAAGMDEYISKPVNLKALVKIIESFFPEQTGSNSDE